MISNKSNLKNYESLGVTYAPIPVIGSNNHWIKNNKKNIKEKNRFFIGKFFF